MRLISKLGSIFFAFKKTTIPKDVRNILIIRSAAIGDVLMSTPLVSTVRKLYPRAKISYLVGDWSKQVLANNPDINEAISFKDGIISKKEIFAVASLIKRIKRKKFDLAIVLDKSYLWGLFAYFCKIHFRVGFDRCGEGFANNLNVKFAGRKYELDYNLDIASILKANTQDRRMKLNLTKKDIQFANNFIKNNKLKGRTLVGLAPGGARNPGQELALKRWPKDKYVDLVNELSKRKNTKIILFGGKWDKEINNYVIKNTHNGVIDTAGKITIQQSAALVGKCKCFVTNDSGSMHIAATTNTKVIALFGPTAPKRFAPNNAVVITSKKCKPCYDIYGRYKRCKEHECMDGIKVKDVLRRIR
ncbi:lipopolysaccharide heptosyltransferase II [Nanoarchaeota archaeon]